MNEEVRSPMHLKASNILFVLKSLKRMFFLPRWIISGKHQTRLNTRDPGKVGFL